MKDALEDIRSKLQQGIYRNEEHVRLSLVARLLHALGWNIWDPVECNTEFKTVPTEDNKRVDIALFLNQRTPSVYIETKPVGGIQDRLGDIEIQMRDYSRNNTAQFSVITDGRYWRFYYSQTGGTFSDKCFENLDLLTDELADIEVTFTAFLAKSEIASGRAKQSAEQRLEEGQEVRAMRECLPKARRAVNQAPYPALPDALVRVVMEDWGRTISRDKVIQFIEHSAVDGVAFAHEPIPVTKVVQEKHEPFNPPSNNVRNLKPDSPVALAFTKLIEARISDKAVGNWNSLLDAGVRLAHSRALRIDELNRLIGYCVKEGSDTTNGYQPLAGTPYSLQGVDANNAWKHSYALARKLGVEIYVRFVWRSKEGAAYPGEEGILHWEPGASR